MSNTPKGWGWGAANESRPAAPPPRGISYGGGAKPPKKGCGKQAALILVIIVGLPTWGIIEALKAVF